jgi:hypothetical protein
MKYNNPDCLKYLWLDDIRKPPNSDFYWVRSFDEAKEAILLGQPWSGMSLDHDLGEAKTGYDLVLWLEKACLWPTKWIHVHSANPVGTSNMLAVIKRSATASTIYE